MIPNWLGWTMFIGFWTVAGFIGTLPMRDLGWWRRWMFFTLPLVPFFLLGTAVFCALMEAIANCKDLWDNPTGNR